MKNILKKEKGSITLFVLVAMLFMAMFLMAVYTLSTNNEIATRNANKKLKSIYEIGVGKEDKIYPKLKEIDDEKNTEEEPGDEDVCSLCKGTRRCPGETTVFKEYTDTENNSHVLFVCETCYNYIDLDGAGDGAVCYISCPSCTLTACSDCQNTRLCGR